MRSYTERDTMVSKRVGWIVDSFIPLNISSPFGEGAEEVATRKLHCKLQSCSLEHSISFVEKLQRES